MPGSSAFRRLIAARRRRQLGRLAGIIAAAVLSGCSELVIEGDIKDRETARPIPDVQIDQTRGASWHKLGTTDTRGKYWILRNEVRDGRVRLSKSGYHTQIVTDGEFRNGQGFQLVPSEQNPDDF